MTYPNPDGSSYPKGRGGSTSRNTAADYGATSKDQARSHGDPDAWTQQFLDALNGGKPINTETTE